MKAIFGKKIGMTSIFETNGRMLPVTVVRCLPNVVLEAKNLNSKDQTIIKVGYGEEKEKNTKAYIGTFKKVNAASREHIATICDFGSQVNVGDMINPNIFESGEYIDVQGVTRGRGYTGAIARWNFKIGPLSHGHGFPHRWQGSIAFGRGGSQGQRVPKGKKMAGQYGNEYQTMQNLQVVAIDEKNNLIYVLGSIPGAVGNYVKIQKAVKMTKKPKPFNIVTKAIQEEIQAEAASIDIKEANPEVIEGSNV